MPPCGAPVGTSTQRTLIVTVSDAVRLPWRSTFLLGRKATGDVSLTVTSETSFIPSGGAMRATRNGFGLAQSSDVASAMTGCRPTRRLASISERLTDSGVPASDQLLPRTVPIGTVRAAATGTDMEFTEYLAVLRRHWRIWVGCTAVALVLAAVVLETTPRTYEATARVFVSASPSISNSAQFVNQRAKSYPAVAVSEAVLGPVIERLGLDTTAAELRSRVTADNPVDTSQVQVTTTGSDPDEVAAISNAVAEELAEVVEELETPASGNRPVTLTVNDPATAPTRAVTPVPLDVLGLGLIAGLFVGLAAAVLRSRLDTRLYTEDEVRTAWGTDEEIDLLAPRRGRAGQSALTGRPAAALRAQARTRRRGPPDPDRDCSPLTRRAAGRPRSRRGGRCRAPRPGDADDRDRSGPRRRTPDGRAPGRPPGGDRPAGTPALLA